MKKLTKLNGVASCMLLSVVILLVYSFKSSDATNEYEQNIGSCSNSIVFETQTNSKHYPLKEKRGKSTKREMLDDFMGKPKSSKTRTSVCLDARGQGQVEVAYLEEGLQHLTKRENGQDDGYTKPSIMRMTNQTVEMYDKGGKLVGQQSAQKSGRADMLVELSQMLTVSKNRRNSVKQDITKSGGEIINVGRKYFMSVSFDRETGEKTKVVFDNRTERPLFSLTVDGKGKRLNEVNYSYDKNNSTNLPNKVFNKEYYQSSATGREMVFEKLEQNTILEYK